MKREYGGRKIYKIGGFKCLEKLPGVKEGPNQLINQSTKREWQSQSQM